MHTNAGTTSFKRLVVVGWFQGGGGKWVVLAIAFATCSFI